MEDNNSTGSVVQPTATAEPSQGTKIDVSVSPAPAVDAVDQPSLAPEPPANGGASLAPEPTLPSTNTELSDSSVQPAPQQADDAGAQMPPITPSKKAKGSGKKMMVILVVVIALVLIAGAGYMYLKNKNKTATVTPAVTSTAAKVEKATSKDVTSASSDLDTNLQKVNDTKDFASTDLTDSALGIQ